MKILQIIPSLSKGGAERLVLDICNALMKRADCTVKLITFRNENAYTFLTNELNWDVVPSTVQLSMTGKTNVNISALQQAIEVYQPDIIHSHLFETEVVLSQIRYTKAKYVVHFHDNMVQFENLTAKTFFDKRKLTNYYEKRLVVNSYRKRETNFIAISENGFYYIQNVLPKEYNKILLHNAIDTDRFQSKSIKVENLVLTTIGSLVDKKGQDLAIRTVWELQKQGLHFILNILGDGPNRIKLQELINELELHDYVRLYGNVDHPEVFLQESMIYIHTAVYEPFGLVLLEAMACGLPVICTDGGGNRDLIQDGENGYIITARDPLILSKIIEQLLSNKQLYEKMKLNAVAYAQKFSMVNYTDELIKLYKNGNQ